MPAGTGQGRTSPAANGLLLAAPLTAPHPTKMGSAVVGSAIAVCVPTLLLAAAPSLACASCPPAARAQPLATRRHPLQLCVIIMLAYSCPTRGRARRRRRPRQRPGAIDQVCQRHPHQNSTLLPEGPASTAASLYSPDLAGAWWTLAGPSPASRAVKTYCPRRRSGAARARRRGRGADRAAGPSCSRRLDFASSQPAAHSSARRIRFVPIF